MINNIVLKTTEIEALSFYRRSDENMGRAGSGGGRSSSGGGHSAGRTGGGHRVSSGGSSGRSRAGSGSLGGAPRGGGSHGGPVSPPPSRRTPPPPPRRMPPPPPRRMPPPLPRRGYVGAPPRRGGGCLSVIILFILLVAVIIALQGGIRGQGSRFHADSSSSSSSQSSTIVREKLDTNNAYINDCIIDQLGWFDNVSKTESQLKKFWEETGIQPYILLKDYDASLTTDSEKEQWAIDYYDENFDTENIFLFVYFAEEDTDNDVGYMAYANGYQTSSIMDSEAVEIFWNNIDKYWYTDMSTDKVFVNAFNDTANTIMHVSTTNKDILKWVLIVIAIILLGIIIIKLVKQKNQRAREKAEEDQRILNTPINDVAQDNLEDKYL